MDPQTVWKWLEQLLGAILIVIALTDVFITVLYARTHVGIIGDVVSRVTWRSFEFVAERMGRRRGKILSYLGPVVVLLVVIAWIVVLTLGAGLVIHPMLGEGFKALHTETPTDFATALLVGGHSITVVSENNFEPATSGARLFFIFMSIAGMIVTTLTLTYILHLYTALQERDALGLEMHLLTGDTGDAAELLAGLGAHGHFSHSQTELSELGTKLVSVQEEYHHYPILFFFRFEEPYYAVSSIALVGLDAVALIKSGLDDEEYAWLKESAAVTQLNRAALRLVTTLMDAFMGGPPDPPAAIPAQTVDRWRSRYHAGLRRMQQAGIKTVADQEEGAETYVALRSKWDYLVAHLAPALGYTMAEIDPEGSDPQQSDQRPQFEERMHSSE